VHQVVEFGNRMITFLVVLTAALAVLAVTRARRRREVLVYAWLMPASTVAQAVMGGITVLTGLLWWTVAIHLVASMTMVWLAVLLYVKIGEPDDAELTPVVPRPLRQLTALTAVVLAVQLVSGTLVTGAGPHAGDKSVETAGAATAGRDHHAGACAQLIAGGLPGLDRRPGLRLACGARAEAVVLRLWVLLVLVCAQGVVGTVQFFTGVPAALVAVHVAGAAACTAATAALWASMRQRAEPKPVEG